MIKKVKDTVSLENLIPTISPKLKKMDHLLM